MSQQLSTEMAIRQILDRVFTHQLSLKDYDAIVALLRSSHAGGEHLEGMENQSEMAIHQIFDRVFTHQLSLKDYDAIVALLRSNHAEMERLEGIESRLVVQLLSERVEWKKEWIVEFLGHNPLLELEAEVSK